MVAKNKKVSISMILIYIILLSLCLVCIIPFLIIISASFSDEAAIRQFGYSIIPREFSTFAYEYLFMKNFSQLLSSYNVTILITAVGTASGMLVMCGMAYPLSRRDFKYGNLLSIFVYFTMLFSGGLVPSYIVVANVLQLKDTIYTTHIKQTR